LTIAVSKY